MISQCRAPVAIQALHLLNLKQMLTALNYLDRHTLTSYTRITQHLKIHHSFVLMARMSSLWIHALCFRS